MTAKQRDRIVRAAMRWYQWMTGGRGDRQMKHWDLREEHPIRVLGKACAAAKKGKKR